MPTLASVVAIYKTHEQVELAVKDLQEAGVDMKSLSIAAKDSCASGERNCNRLGILSIPDVHRRAGSRPEYAEHLLR
jgi:hypothetical protein